MSSADRELFERSIDAYLDGRLDAAQRAEFEGLLERVPELKEELALQQRIDRSVERLFAPGQTSVEFSSATAEPSRGMPFRQKINRRWLPYAVAAAAGILIVAGTGWWYWNYLDEAPQLAPMKKQTLVEFYEDVRQHDFEPDWECKDAKEFAVTFHYRLGTALTLAQSRQGVEPLGLCYTHTISPRTMAMTFKVKGQGVVVFVDRNTSEPVDGIEQCSGLHLFTRKLNNLTLYEVSPLEEPSVLEMWSERDIPEEWKKSGYREPPRRR